MTEPIHPIARQLLGDSDEPDRKVPCAVCGESTDCPGFIVAAVKTWNEVNRDKQPPIRPSELGVCCAGECTSIMHARKHTEVQNENARTLAYLGMLFAGKYSPESIAWLREHGCGRYVTKVLETEGNRSHEPPREEAPHPAQGGFSYGDR